MWRLPLVWLLVAAACGSGDGAAVRQNVAVTFTRPRELDPNVPAFPGQRGGGDWMPRLAPARSSSGLYVSWVRFGPRAQPGTAMLAFSANGGDDFSPPVRVSPSDQRANYAPSVTVAGDGTVYVAWIDIMQWREACDFDTQTASCSRPVSLFVASSRDRGRTFGPPSVVSSSINFGCPGPGQPGTGESYCDALHSDTAPADFPVVAGDTGGLVYAAWWDGDPQAPARISVAVSHDRAGEWATKRPVGVPPGRDADQQHRPALSLAPNGRLDVAYYNVSANGAQDVYITSSTDRASTFATPRKVTDQPSDSAVGPMGGDGFHPTFGGWLGVASKNRVVDVAWTDSRRGNTDNADQAIFFMTVAVRS